jgi:nucleoside-diphosphate-sugar epimerase
MDRETVVLHSIPVPGVMEALRRSPPARVVYLSTTGVYGATPVVDATTPTSPRTEREVLRAREEKDVLAGPWSGLVLRPAAIYGPGRGIHASMREGKYRLMGEGGNYVSRIHVDDLARHTEAAMYSELTGAYPVADEEPCTSREIAEYCAGLLGISMPQPASADELGETRRADRRVDGSAIRKLLSVDLQYPSYREGIPACLEAEARALSTS